MNLPLLIASPPEVSTHDLLRFAHKLLRERAAGAGDVDERIGGAVVLQPVDGGGTAAFRRDRTSKRWSAYFAERNVACDRWILPAQGVPESGAAQLSDWGYSKTQRPIAHWVPRELSADGPTVDPSTLVVPARSAYAAVARLADHLCDALDDPRFDGLVALRRGVAIGFVGVLTLGEHALVDPLLTRPVDPLLASYLMGRARDICARAAVRHAFALGGPGVDFEATLIGHRIAYEAFLRSDTAGLCPYHRSPFSRTDWRPRRCPLKSRCRSCPTP